MNKIKFTAIAFLSAIMVVVFTACPDNRQSQSEREEEYLKIIESYVDNVVIYTYSNLADNAIEMNYLCKNLKETITNSKITEICAKWKNARSYWEQSEAFLYGPAAYNNLDPHIDSWPLDKNQLDQVLLQPDIMSIDGAYARNNFGASLLGFHAAEYILFREGQARSAADISPQEVAYLCAIAQVLAEDCVLLEGNWSGISSLSPEKKQLLENAQLSISSDFGHEMKTAGKPGSRYPSPQQAIFEILEGCKDIADEVGASKIADPVASGNVLEVESWYSWNSLTDFVNNIISIENSYIGNYNGLSENSLCNLILKENPKLDEEIKQNIASAKEKIMNIGEPFRNHLNNVEGAQAATDACDALFMSLQKVSAIIY